MYCVVLCVQVCSACACTRHILHTHTLLLLYILLPPFSQPTVECMQYLCRLQWWPHSLQHGCTPSLNRKVTRHPYLFLLCYTLSPSPASCIITGIDSCTSLVCNKQTRDTTYLDSVRFFLLGDGANPCKCVPLMVYSQFYELLFQAMCPCAVPSREALTLSPERLRYAYPMPAWSLLTPSSTRGH